MTPTEEQIEAEAENRFPEYLDDGETTHHDTAFDGKQDAFIAGAEWALQQAAPKWISVKKRLPDYNTRVLVKFRPQQPVMEGTLLGIDERVEVSKTSLPPNMKDAMKFRNCFKFYNVVEWMPLPQQ
jgi:Protein of unknown function (DUF551)